MLNKYLIISYLKNFFRFFSIIKKFKYMGNIITRIMNCELEDINGNISVEKLKIGKLEDGNFIISNLDGSDKLIYKTRFTWDGQTIETHNSNKIVYVVTIPQPK